MDEKKKKKNTVKMNIFADVKKMFKHILCLKKYKREKIFNFKSFLTCLSW